MAVMTNQSSVKVIGANGQISLGKQFAGRQVLVEDWEPGVWRVRTVTVVPDNERWGCISRKPIRRPMPLRMPPRVCFEWRDAQAFNVEIVDYH